MPETEKVYIRISPVRDFQTRVVDEDNLANEQTINNISLFFTEPSTTAVTDKYIHTGFTISGDYQLITLPVQPADLLVKDIYVVANFNDQTTLEAITSIDQLKELHTPEVNKTNNLEPLNGFCMYGTLSAFDFTDTSIQPATIPLVRTCAKLRISLTFPQDPMLSITNSYLIQNAASYTYVVPNATHVLVQSDYFNFAAPLPLTDNGSQVYMSNTYVYEASQAPVITLYVHINNSTTQTEFTANLPIPVRNHLYDIAMEVYEDSSITGTRGGTSGSGLVYTYTIKTYDEKGFLISEIRETW